MLDEFVDWIKNTNSWNYEEHNNPPGVVTGTI